MIADTGEEKIFREMYARELHKKKTRSSVNSHFGSDELSDEIIMVKQQELITPGRRGGADKARRNIQGNPPTIGSDYRADQALIELNRICFKRRQKLSTNYYLNYQKWSKYLQCIAMYSTKV